MPNPKDKTVYHVVLNKKTREDFESKYPRLLSKFINNAVELAINNKLIFEKIFFKEN